MDIRKFGKDKVTLIKSLTRNTVRVYINNHEVSCRYIGEINNEDGTITVTLDAEVDVVLTK